MTAAAPSPRRAAVLGAPIGHSLSPILHAAAYDALGLPWSYDAIEVDEQGLPAFLADLDESWVGLSLTMPLKRAVLPLLHAVTPLAACVAAANTVLVGEGGRLTGDNTDVPGLMAALRAAGVCDVGHAVLLGAGATACSAAAALAGIGVSALTVAVRDGRRAGQLRSLAEELGLSLAVEPWSLPEAGELVISTTPAGSTDALADALPPASVPGRVLFDVVYSPWPTMLGTAWSRNGGQVIGGFELLLHQAALQVELMTGQPAPLAAMQSAGLAALRRREAGSGH